MIRPVLLLVTLLGSFAISSGLLAADGDVSADVDGGFGALIEQTKGVVLRVPVGDGAKENSDEAELRFYAGRDEVRKGTDVEKLWDASTAAVSSAALEGTNLPAGSDSSTNGWHHWYGHGWVQPYYYNHWYPSFYWSGSYYHYGFFHSWYRPGYFYGATYFPGYRYYYYNYYY